MRVVADQLREQQVGGGGEIGPQSVSGWALPLGCSRNCGRAYRQNSLTMEAAGRLTQSLRQLEREISTVYARPRTIEEAALAMAAPGALALCGGTDVYPAHVGRPLTRPLVDLSGIAALRGIAETAEGFRFGAATSWSMIAKAALPPAFDGLQGRRARGGLDPDPEPRHHRRQSLQRLARGRWRAAAARLDASVELASRSRAARAGARPPSSPAIARRRCARARSSPPSSCRSPPPGARSAFVKLGARRYLVISILMAAAVVEKDAAGRIAKAAVAVGAASPVAQRLPELEQALRGLAPGEGRPPSSRRAHLAGSRPSTTCAPPPPTGSKRRSPCVGEALDRAAGAALT